MGSQGEDKFSGSFLQKILSLTVIYNKNLEFTEQMEV